VPRRTLRSTPESGGRAAWDRHKRVRRSKLHRAVDTLGHLLALHVTPTNADARSAVSALAEAVQDATGESVDLAYIDQGYTGERPAQAIAAHGIALKVVKLAGTSPAGSAGRCRGRIAVRLHPHGRKRRLHVAGLDKNRGQAAGTSPAWSHCDNGPASGPMRMRC
jgi:transposase